MLAQRNVVAKQASRPAASRARPVVKASLQKPQQQKIAAAGLVGLASVAIAAAPVSSATECALQDGE